MKDAMKSEYASVVWLKKIRYETCLYWL